MMHMSLSCTGGSKCEIHMLDTIHVFNEYIILTPSTVLCCIDVFEEVLCHDILLSELLYLTVQAAVYVIKWRHLCKEHINKRISGLHIIF